MADLDEGCTDNGETTVNQNVISFVKIARDKLAKLEEKLY